MKAKVYRKQSRGRQMKRWMNVVQQDLKQFKVNVNITGDHAEWRRRTRAADPSPDGCTA